MQCRFCAQHNRTVERRCRFCGNMLDAENDVTASERPTVPQPRLTLPPVGRDDFSSRLDPGRILSSQGTLLVIAAVVGLAIFVTIIARSTCAAS